MGVSVTAGPATAYGTPPVRGSGAGAEVWLRGNTRPVVWAGGVCVAVMAAAVVVAVATGAGPAVTATLAALTVIVAAAAVVIARAAAGPRLGRAGNALVVRLSPWRTEAVPLDVVECVFPGSQPLDGPVLRHVHADEEADRPPSSRRVGTLVIRFAERAVEWRERPTFAPWGTWHDGHAIVDGRWCEPLSAEVARGIGQRLVEARREAAGGTPA